MTQQHEKIELAKKEIDYDRQVAVFGKKAADNVLSFWVLGYSFAKKEQPEPAAEKGEEIDFKTNSEIGSYHWFNTLISKCSRMAEYIANNPDDKKIVEYNYGLQIKEILCFISENFKNINQSHPPVKPQVLPSDEEIAEIFKNDYMQEDKK